MATKLTKAVTREIGMIDRKGKELRVTLEPGDILTFKAKGSRRSHSIYLGHCLAMATIMTADEDYKKRMDEYNAKRARGGRPRKPKKPYLPFNDTYFKVLNRKS
jgi:hypothetical protein